MTSEFFKEFRNIGPFVTSEPASLIVFSVHSGRGCWQRQVGEPSCAFEFWQFTNSHPILQLFFWVGRIHSGYVHRCQQICHIHSHSWSKSCWMLESYKTYSSFFCWGEGKCYWYLLHRLRTHPYAATRAQALWRFSIQPLRSWYWLLPKHVTGKGNMGDWGWLVMWSKDGKWRIQMIQQLHGQAPLVACAWGSRFGRGHGRDS